VRSYPVSPRANNFKIANTVEESCDPVEEVTDGGVKDVDAEAEQESGEARASRTISQPKTPSAYDRRMHELTHCPYRSWCDHCVRGTGTEYAHSTVVGTNAEEGVPRVLMDYAFLTEEVQREEDEHGSRGSNNESDDVGCEGNELWFSVDVCTQVEKRG
jgi:hypothetical protein